MDSKSGAQEAESLFDGGATDVLYQEDSADQVANAEADLDEPPRGDAQSNPNLSVIGKSLVFKGELTAAEDLLVQGRIKGSLKNSAPNLTVGPDGRIDADIDANGVVVQGVVRGDIRGKESVVVEPSARVRGNLFAPVIGLKEGAQFKGRIDMDASTRREPTSDLAVPADADRKPPKAKRNRRSRRKARSAQEARTAAEVAEEILEESE